MPRDRAACAAVPRYDPASRIGPEEAFESAPFFSRVRGNPELKANVFAGLEGLMEKLPLRKVMPPSSKKRRGVGGGGAAKVAKGV